MTPMSRVRMTTHCWRFRVTHVVLLKNIECVDVNATTSESTGPTKTDPNRRHRRRRSIHRVREGRDFLLGSIYIEHYYCHCVTVSRPSLYTPGNSESSLDLATLRVE